VSDRNILKDSTRSLCPRCYREIPASIIEEDDGVYMEKSCPDHGHFRAMVEKDASVYKTLMNRGLSDRRRLSLVIPVTHRCNLRCKMCFFPDDSVSDPLQESIFRFIDDFDGHIVFSGGEPTLREDLPLLIEHAARQGKNTCIATNGLRLQDKKLVDRLAGAGLDSCLFSLNGLSDTVFGQIEGQPLLEKKMAALENLKGSSVRPILSTTIMSGVNAGELPALADFYLASPSLFLGWRLRTQAAIGKHTDAENLWMSDMLTLVCNTLDIDRDKVLKSLDHESVYHGVSHLYLNALSVSGKNRKTLGYFAINQLSYKGFRSDKQLKGASLAHKMNLFRHMSRELLSNMSLSQKVEAFSHIFQPSRLKLCKINIFAWPDVTNVDLEEVNQTGIYHVGPSGKILPFVQAIILNNSRPDWNWR
jgi:uncharacterized radical SAM superfamily Fe-S cluster-containing enzyme